MDSIQRSTPPQRQHNAGPGARPKKADKSLSGPKGSSTSARAKGRVQIYDTSTSLSMSQALVSCARLGSWTTSLLSRAVTVVTPPLPAWIAASLQDTSQSLSDYATDCIAQKYTNPPHKLKVAFRGLKKPVENFLTKKLIGLFQASIRDIARECYLPLKESLNSDESTSVDYFISHDINQYFQEWFAGEFKDEKFQYSFDHIEKTFLRRCKPPVGYLYYDFLDALPAKSIAAFRNAVIRENISLEALGYYHYNFICKVLSENRDNIIQSIKRSNAAEVKRVAEEFAMDYESKITSHLQRQASKRLTSQPGRDASPPLPAHGRRRSERPAVDPLDSPERRIEMIMAFEQAHSRLKDTGLNYKEFTSLQKTVNKVLKNGQLKETVSKLCGRTKIDEAALLSQIYTKHR